MLPTDALVGQNIHFKNVLEESVEQSRAIAESISSLTISLQFQDRVTQYLDNCQTLITQAQALVSSKTDTMDAAYVDHQSLQQMADGFLLSELRQMFIQAASEIDILEQFVEKNQTQSAESAQRIVDQEDDDDIELF